MHSHNIEISDRQTLLKLDLDHLRKTVTTVLEGESVAVAEIRIAVVDDAEIHRINRQFLHHDYPTDVITFPMSEPGEPLEADIVVSTETAVAAAREFSWSAADELRLYVIHGMLHLTGFDDTDESSRQSMRQRETHYLGQLGIESPTPIASRQSGREGDAC